MNTVLNAQLLSAKYTYTKSPHYTSSLIKSNSNA